MLSSAKARWVVALAAAAILVLVATAVAQIGPGVRPEGGMRGQMLFGTVAALDADRGILGVMPADGQGVWAAVTPETQVTKRVEVTAAELQLEQTITVTGQPTALIASQIQVLDPAAAQAAAMRGQFPGAPDGPGGGAAGPAPGMGPEGRVRLPQFSTTGQITALQPLTVTTSEGLIIAVALAPDATVTQTVPATLADVVVGEQVLVFGQYDANGLYVARQVRVGEEPRLQFQMRPGGEGGGRFGGARGGDGDRPQRQPRQQQ